MFRACAIGILILFTSQASAQYCPDFYRFVDFGQAANDGNTYRGGIILRSEGFEGQFLLLTEHTQCRDLVDIAKDGHGNPIPVVTSINYDPAETGLDLAELNVSLAEDIEISVSNTTKLHQALLEHDDAIATRGSNFLCVRLPEQIDLSCQLVSPYPGNIPLFVLCGPTQCEMPMLAINSRLQAKAIWDIEDGFLNDADAAGSEISLKVQQVHDFLQPLSASL